MSSYHQPVMPKEALAGLDLQPGGIYVDATYGGGGHAQLILDQLGDKGRLYAFDQDEAAWTNRIDDPRLELIPHNFRYLKRFLRLRGVSAVDGILADLGVSSHQLDTKERGFSFRFEGPLDMRMSPEGPLTAADILGRYAEAELQEMFSRYGEVRNARTLAKQIVQERSVRPIRTVSDLLAILEPLVRGQRHRYLAQVFQALRMEVNDEIGALADFLAQSLEVLRPGGRQVVIAYHSIEDRVVKNFFKTGNAAGAVEQDFFGHISRPFTLVTKNALAPEPAEIAQNPRARSARLRIAAKNENPKQG